MRQPSYRFLLFAGAAAIGLCGMARSASAVVLAANPGDFQVIESCDASSGCGGTFTVVNNSGGDGDWYIYGFKVGNPNALGDGTSQTNWTATLGCFTGSCEGNDAFIYNNPTTPFNTDLANDIGPGQSSSLFTFNSIVLASPVTLSLVNTEGQTTTAELTAEEVPEPASLAVLGCGLLGLVRVTRRGRTPAQV